MICPYNEFTRRFSHLKSVVAERLNGAITITMREGVTERIIDCLKSCLALSPLFRERRLGSFNHNEIAFVLNFLQWRKKTTFKSRLSVL
jgi:hypothetical protein